ncbi:hypothetical protein EVAR_8945_1 [Eumeta japonica]|uniref:Uncharacterized protein n=1 Tax=Eumeta variegata TaxID=151549 RepID=A0A4C1U151_EUMVA|nr:hypothetical protein EVAR_8945_1 [Eumeta japonica]
MLPHTRTSSRRGYPDGPVVMAPFQGSKLKDFPRQLEIKRSCHWVHQHRPRPSRPSLGVIVKWWIAAPSRPEKLDDGEPRKLRQSLTCFTLEYDTFKRIPVLFTRRRYSSGSRTCRTSGGRPETDYQINVLEMTAAFCYLNLPRMPSAT